MDGLPTPLDLPEAEKTYSHVSAGRTEHFLDSPFFSTASSPTTSESEPRHEDELMQPLSPATTRTTRPSISREISRYTTHGTTYTSDPSFEVDFDDDSNENPRNWSGLYKSFVVFAISFSTLVVVVYSTSYTATFVPMSLELGVTDSTIPTLGVTTYLLGLAVGSLILAPISETYGRRPVYLAALLCFFILVLPGAIAKDITTIVVLRFFAALAGSACIANAPGTIGDIVSDDKRALVFSVWSIGPMNGPVIGLFLSASKY